MAPSALLLAAVAAVAAVFLARPAAAFYLPGVAPQSWRDGELVPVQVDALSSPKTRIPFDYYKFPFCVPNKEDQVSAGETLGEVLTGNRLESTGYEVRMNVDVNCRVLCQVDLSQEDVIKMKKLVDDQYVMNLLVDNLPGAMEIEEGQAIFGLGYWVGGPLLDEVTADDVSGDDAGVDDSADHIGFMNTAKAAVDAAKRIAAAPRYINNHIKLKLWYHVPLTAQGVTGYTGFDGDADMAAMEISAQQNKADGSDEGGSDGSPSQRYPAKRIVRFEVHPYSYAHHYDTSQKFTKDTDVTTCGDAPIYAKLGGDAQNVILKPESKTGQKIVYSYAVEWAESETAWSTRWDIYLSMGGDNHDDVHWMSITNSILVAVFLSALVALILVRTLRRDLMRYNRIPTEEEKAEEQEESGWKLVHGDVFRAPAYPLWFSVFVGTGVQVFWMALFVIVFAAMGFLSPANRGSFVTGFIVLFVLMGAVGGYFSARMYKTFNGVGYQRTTLMTAFGFPAFVFAGFFIINLFVWGAGSSAAVPFTSMIAICALWFGISVPLCFVGAFLGYRQDPYEHPTRVNTLPRQIPVNEWYFHWLPQMLIAGVLPFACVSIELYFIMTSIWFGATYYYVFGFLLLVMVLLFITLSEMSITLSYFQLCAEDYRWWWPAFANSGSVAIYVFAYGMYFFATESSMDSAASLAVYFGYTMIMAVTLWLMCASIGFTTTYVFLRKIFGSIKVD